MDQKTLKQVLTYDPKTGEFRWKINQPPRGKIGAVAGYFTHGYIKLSYKGKKHYAHRLAFLYVTGSIPEEIDHKNQCKSDNRWDNLRASNRYQNLANVKGRSGVRFRYGKWYARYGRTGHIGVFKTESEAREAYLAVATKMAGKDPNGHAVDPPRNRTSGLHQPKTYGGKTVSQLARQHGIRQTTLHHRLHKQGLPLELALRRDMTK